MKLVACILLFTVALAQAELDRRGPFVPIQLNVPKHFKTPNGIPSSRIVGGEEAEPNSFPHQAALFLPLAEGTAFCGGSLISETAILTAAHCVDGLTGPVDIILGAHQIQEAEPSQVVLTSTDIRIHPGWNSLLIVNDLAIIKLSTAVPLSDKIQPIALPTSSSNTYEGEEATVSGWGLDSDQATSISSVLRYVKVPVITNSVCNIAFLGLIRDSNICTSGSGGKSTCSGDSGGALLVGDVQVGIVSFGISLGCEIGFPAAYTRVTSYLDWISENQ